MYISISQLCDNQALIFSKKNKRKSEKEGADLPCLCQVYSVGETDEEVDKNWIIQNLQGLHFDNLLLRLDKLLVVESKTYSGLKTN